MAKQPPKPNRDLNTQADEALEAPRSMPSAPEKVAALKKAGLLRRAADARGITFAKRRPATQGSMLGEPNLFAGTNLDLLTAAESREHDRVWVLEGCCHEYRRALFSRDWNDLASRFDWARFLSDVERVREPCPRVGPWPAANQEIKTPGLRRTGQRLPDIAAKYF